MKLIEIIDTIRQCSRGRRIRLGKGARASL
jgi:hypothetical protein